jgi:hypothetical protein
MEEGLRYNSNKTKWGLVPFSALTPMVEVLEFGAEKYEALNWMKGLSIREICESLLRHTFAFMEGEDKDSESGISHVGHMQCNTLFLGWMSQYRPDKDDRYKVDEFILDDFKRAINGDS